MRLLTQITSEHSAKISRVLTPELLETLRARAVEHDENNTFPHDDLQDLAETGYLRAQTPVDLGGLGWDFAVITEAQRLLATASPATALAVNMHQIINAVASVFAIHGDDSLTFIHRGSANGEIYAFGISEAGNDAVLFDSSTEAVANPDGSVTLTGTKIFTSLSPAWTHLLTFGKTPDGSQLIFGVLDRSAEGISADDSSWDMLGMRATFSLVTRLEQATISAEKVIRRLPVGPNQDLLVFGIFSTFLTLLSAVYTGIGDRAVELAQQALALRTSTVQGITLDQDPVLRYHAGEAALRQLTQNAQLRYLSEAIRDNKDFGPEWFPRLVANKTHAVRTAKEQVDYAFQISGGASFNRHTEISRLYRDVIAGFFHPSNDASAHNTLATWALGPLDQ